MTTQNAEILTFALSFCTFIFTFCILKGFGQIYLAGKRMVRLILYIPITNGQLTADKITLYHVKGNAT